MYHININVLLFFLFFFFSSRRRHTRFDCDWSSDVCSSDLLAALTIEESPAVEVGERGEGALGIAGQQLPAPFVARWHGDRGSDRIGQIERSEERRVGKECRCRWSPYHVERKVGEHRRKYSL